MAEFKQTNTNLSFGKYRAVEMLVPLDDIVSIPRLYSGAQGVVPGFAQAFGAMHGY